MSETWDAIVIGAGPSGLFTGALLAARGQRVLVLEAGDRIGGRRGSGVKDGAPIEDGAFAISLTGGWQDVYAEIGKPVPTGRNFGKAEYFRDGEWRPLLDLQDRGELRKVLATIAAMSYKDAAAVDDLSIEQWLAEQTTNQRIADLFFIQLTGALVANTPDQISAGEGISLLKQTLDRNGTLGKFFIVVDGSSPSLYGPLRDAIEEAGGEVRLDTPVQDVLVHDGRAIGVEIETGPKIAATHVRDTERLLATDVICTVPLWQLFNVVSEDHFPDDYVANIKELAPKVSHVVGVTYGVTEPAWDAELMRWYLPVLPKLGVVLGAYYESPAVLQFYTQLHWYEHPYLLDQRSAANRRKTRQFLDAFEQEALEVFPEVVPTISWRMPNLAPFAVAQAPGLVGTARPSWRSPIPHLHLVSNHVREARGIGHDAAAHVAIACADHLAPRPATAPGGAR